MTRTERKMGCQRRALWPAGQDLPLFCLPGTRQTEATEAPKASTTTDAEALARYQHQLYAAHARALLANKE